MIRLIFDCSNKASTCDWISMFLNENGVKCVNLNGKMPLDIRMGKLNSFQLGDVDVISCTDISSRGIDTIRVSLNVIHTGCGLVHGHLMLEPYVL
jgi:superfamily II DNA/RNA helicase